MKILIKTVKLQSHFQQLIERLSQNKVQAGGSSADRVGAHSGLRVVSSTRSFLAQLPVGKAERNKL